MTRPVISLGDALRAAAHLEPADDEARDAILQLLGLKAEHTLPTQRSIGAWKPSSTASVLSAQRRRELPGKARFTAPEQQSERRAGSADRPVRGSIVSKVRSGGGVFEPPAWLGEPGDTIGTEAPAGTAPIDPLFGRVTERAILSAALATAVPEGELDFEQIVETLGNREPLDCLPRLPAPTLRRGAQVLVDRSEAMDPFARDQQGVVRALDDILADDRLQVLSFDRCPGRGVGTGDRDAWGPWRPPPPGTPVVAITDLGIGGPLLDDLRASPGEWMRFARRVRSAGHVLIALVPYEAGRWPPAVARALTPIHWSERTSVGEVRRALRDALQRTG